MSDERLNRLEDAVSLLREEKASLATSVAHLTDAVEKLTNTVDGLNAAMNRGRGALWVIVAASSGAGAVIAKAISIFFGKGS